LLVFILAKKKKALTLYFFIAGGIVVWRSFREFWFWCEWQFLYAHIKFSDKAKATGMWIIPVPIAVNST
jgi:hypothetical protein